MRLLVFGKTGQVATELAAQAPGATLLGRDAADLEDPAACAGAIRAARPDAVINAAAWTAVDTAEAHPETAFRVNAGAPGAMAAATADLGIPLVHLSTDYVFDGSGDRPWRPGDPTGPLGVYGASKLAGEEAIRATGTAHAILRTSWVVSAHGRNFVKTMLALSETRAALTVVEDQTGGPTPARDIAGTCVNIAAQLAGAKNKSGTYHYSGAPDTTWADFARAIFAGSGRDIAVTGIPTAAYPTPAARPLNSRLDCTATEAAFGIPRPDWRRGLTHILTELGARPT